MGFGPRDCSDYQTGVSIIPIERLTEADRKWMLTAEYGGSGGRPIETGMVVEEPDIEIGAGVSSKGECFPSSWRTVITDLQQPSAGGLQPTRAADAARCHRAPSKTESRRGQSARVQAAQAQAPAVPATRQSGMRLILTSGCHPRFRALGSRSRGCRCCLRGS